MLKSIALAIVGLAAGSSTPPEWGDQGDGTYKNPVLSADFSDPDVIAVGDDFYLISSEFHFMGIPVLHSVDLVNWEFSAMVFHSLNFTEFDTMNGYGKGTWPPSIRRSPSGEFFIFVCSPEQGLFMSKAPHPTGPWSPMLLVHAVEGTGKGIGWEDPCPFWDDEGNAYLWHSYLGCGPIIVHKMAPDGSKLFDDGTEVYRGPCAEGTKFYSRNGYVYLLIPEGGVGGGWEEALRAKSIYGPYKNKTILHQGSTAINGPHQGGLIQIPSGEWWFMHFQKAGTQGRIVHLQPCTWQDDWPLCGVDIDGDGIGEPVLQHVKPQVSAMQQPIRSIAASDDFSGSSLAVQWEWNHNPVESAWKLADGSLCLTSVTSDQENAYLARNTLTQKLLGRKGVASTELVTAALKEGQRAGLMHLSSKADWIGVEKNAGDGTINFMATIDGKTTKGGVFVGSTAHLRSTIDFDGESVFEVSDDGILWTQLGGELTLKDGNWKGDKLGLFSYHSPGGTACFRSFQYEHDGPPDPMGAYSIV